MFRTRLVPIVLSACGAAFALTGCTGHGTYTGEGKNLAQQRSLELTSGTKWNMAQQAFMGGNLDKALKKVDESLSINPNVAKSHLLRGRILIEKSELGKAMESLETASTLDPTMHEAFYYIGIVQERLDHPDRALEAYTKAADLDPSSGQYAIAVAEVMIDLKRVVDAEAYLLSKQDLYLNDASVRHTLGMIAMLQGDYDRAVDMYSEARLLGADDPMIVEDLADAQIRSRRFADAEYNLARLLRQPGNESRRDLLHMHARCLIELDRPVEAREDLLSLTKGDAGRTDIEAWLELGQVAWTLGDQPRLRDAAARVVALDPNRQEGYVLRALQRRDTGDAARALDDLNTALRITPQDAMVLTLKALVQQELGRHDEALRTLRDAQRIDPQNGSIAALIRTVEQARALATAGEG
ncbi:MAG: tetratricopeptide repeat protein [Phycisphaeraceae bacterium]|nr:tetratricopeptide repeat protein [Phycisphaeraceae bacterium]